MRQMKTERTGRSSTGRTQPSFSIVSTSVLKNLFVDKTYTEMQVRVLPSGLKEKTMGAIIQLRKMPEKCRDCPFAEDDVTFCRLRNTRLTFGSHRTDRMPLCPLENEGQYLSRVLRIKEKKQAQKQHSRAIKKAMVECCGTCVHNRKLFRYDYSRGGCEKTACEGFACAAFSEDGSIIHSVGKNIYGGLCDRYERRDSLNEQKTETDRSVSDDGGKGDE